jgi:hypothetical protein
VFVSITDPRQTKKSRYDLVEMLVIAVSGVLSSADTFVDLDPVPRKGGIKVRRLIAATSDVYRAQRFGLLSYAWNRL